MGNFIERSIDVPGGPLVKVGDVYERLTVVRIIHGTHGVRGKFVVSCSCGGVKKIQSTDWKGIKSCGCYKKDHPGNFKHGLSCVGGKVTPECRAWHHMIQRCYWKTHKYYDHYGGRGINVCKRWRDSFENFLSDVGARPSSLHSLGRIDNDGSYTPKNVVWQTRAEQSVNKTTTHFITFHGETFAMKIWAKRLKIKYSTLIGRLKNGWSINRALTEPVHQRGR